eukprot:COSAG01_NODE_36718_length_513_cov_1.321256_1_plen_94_part_10
MEFRVPIKGDKTGHTMVLAFLCVFPVSYASYAECGQAHLISQISCHSSNSVTVVMLLLIVLEGWPIGTGLVETTRRWHTRPTLVAPSMVGESG